MPKLMKIEFEADDPKVGLSPAELLAALNEVDDGMLDTNWRITATIGWKNQIKKLTFTDISETFPKELQK